MSIYQFKCTCGLEGIITLKTPLKQLSCPNPQCNKILKEELIPNVTDLNQYK